MELSPNSAPDNLVDLSDRNGDGLQVILWWVRGTLETYVTVQDYKGEASPTTLFVPVPEGTSANDVFYHPFGFEGEFKTYEAEPFDDYVIDPDGTPRINYGNKEDGRGTE